MSTIPTTSTIPGNTSFQTPVPYNGPATNPLERNAVTGALGIQQDPVRTTPASARTTTTPGSSIPQGTIPQNSYPGTTIPGAGRGTTVPSTIPAAPGSSIPARSTVPGATIPGRSTTVPVPGGATVPGSTIPAGTIPRTATPSGSTVPSNRNSSLYQQPVPTNSGSPGLAAPFPGNRSGNPGVIPASGQAPNYRAFPSQLQAN